MKATIVIPVKNDLSLLLKNLRHLDHQEKSLIENIIIVENGSSEISDLNYSNFPLKILKLKEANRSKARNFGAAQSKSEIIIFLDADVILAKDWVVSIMNCFDETTLAVQTPIIPASDKNNFLQKIRKYRAFFRCNSTFFSLNTKDPRKMVLNSAAFAIRATAFKELKGFDEHLNRQEDLDFTQRLLSLTGTIKATSSSQCWVYFEGNIWKYLQREFDCGFQIVRYHEKWSSPSILVSIHILIKNFIFFFKGISKINYHNSLDYFLKLLELTYLCGNGFGILRKMINPYKGNQQAYPLIKAQLSFTN